MSGEQIGFIGLGMMGTPMAARLHAAGVPLAICDARAEVAERFAQDHSGVTVVRDASGFAGCAAVVLMLPNSDAVDAVVLGGGNGGLDKGAGGLSQALRPGAAVIDMSSSQPLRSRALSQALAARGLGFLDAPVSGGVRRAIDGSLAIMVGGDAMLAERWRALLAHLGKAITHVGAVGAGHAMKALNNYVSAAGLVATAEALHIGRRFGLDPAVMVDVLNSSTGRNNTTENKAKAFMLSGNFAGGFALSLMRKDVATALELAQAIDGPTPLARSVVALWQRAEAGLPPGADHTEMYRWVEEDR